MESSHFRFRNIINKINDDYYKDLAKVELYSNEENTLEVIKIKVIPYEGIHKNIEYILTIKFQEPSSWPFVYIDSILYDKIKTTRYLKNQGYLGEEHKGICIKYMGYPYGFSKNFKELCDNKWENYIYYLITFFNNIQDFEKGNGFKSDYKEILGI
jgi:hypothetical protein